MTGRLAVGFSGMVFAMLVLSGCGDGSGPQNDAISDVIGDVVVPDAVDVLDDTRDVPAGDVVVTDDLTGGDCDEPGGLTVTSAGWALEINQAESVITISRVSGVTGPRFVLDYSGVQIGTVPTIDPTLTYDPYPMLSRDSNYTAPSGLQWLGMTAGTCMNWTYADGAWTIDVWFSSNDRVVKGSMRIVPSEDGRFTVTLNVDQTDYKTVYFRIRPDAAEGENYYGLGAYLDQVAHRGKVRAMQLETDFGIESNYNEAHVPVPLLISTRGWGMFVESWYPGAFDCAAFDAQDHVDVVFGTGDASGEGFKFHMYAAEKPLDILGLYYKDAGQALLPARWGLGPVVWKDDVTGQAEVETDLHAIRDLDLPTTAYWIDRPYASGVNAFDFNQANYTDPQSMINLAHDMGFRMALWHTPYISDGKDGDKESSATTEALYQFASDNDYLVHDLVQFNKWGTAIDFTNPDAYSWYQGLIRQYTDMGIEGFKLDYGEDVVVGLLGMDVQNTTFFDGSTERTMHAKYQTFYHRIYAETLPEDGGFLLCRRGVWGDQQNVSVIWPGDLDASFAEHRQQMQDAEGNDYVAVGGLPASVIYGLTLGVSGFPFFGSDTSGYRHSPPNREVFIRWMQQTALSSVMQVGNSSNTVPWDLDSGTDLDVEFQDLYREFARLHLRLWPYEWTFAKRIAETGYPIQRPIGLVWPNAGQHPDDEYMFGDYLLVAPVVKAGAVSRLVYFPEGSWMDWFTGEVFVGPVTVTVDAPLDKLPLYMARGAIVPMLRPTIAAMAPVAEGYDIDTYADDPGIIYPVMYAGDSSSFTLFDGTVIRQVYEVDGLYVEYVPGDEFTSGAFFDIRGIEMPVLGVSMDGFPVEPLSSLEDLELATSGWFMSNDGYLTRVWVKVEGGEHNAYIHTEEPEIAE